MATADLLFVKGPVLIMRDGAVAEALATAGDRILAVGPRAEVERHRGPATRVVDLAGRPLIPGFVDAHTHLVDYGLQLLRLNLSNCPDRDVFLQALRERAKMTPEGGWVVGHSWDESKWSDRNVPTLAEIDAAVGGKPAILARVDMHMGLASSAALEKAGLESATGELREDAFYRVWDLLRPHPDTLQRAVVAAMRKFAEHGVTGASVIADLAELDALRRAEEVGTLRARCSVYLREKAFREAVQRGVALGGTGLVRVRGLKLFADGSIGSRSAAVSRGYADDPSHKGELVYAREELRSLTREARESGWQIAIHAIGDAAIDEALDAIEAAGATGAERARIEHLELFTDAHAQRMASAGIVASVQPNFIGEWGHAGQMYEERLGKDVVPRHNRLRMLRDLGVPLAFGSDHMPFGPLYGVHCAVNGPTAAQRLTVDEALEAYTIDAARASFLDDASGSLEVGKRADLVVLSRDPRADPASVQDLQAAMTVFGGRVVHER